MSHNSTKLPEITIIHNPTIPRNYLNEFENVLIKLTPNVYINEEVAEPQAAMEWVLPAAIAIYIGKGFIDGFLEELGSGAAKTLKSVLSRLFLKSKEKPVQWITESYNRSVSPTFSITFIFEDISFRHGIRFIFPNELDETGIVCALNDLHAGIDKAVSTERRFLQQAGGSFVGSRVISYVYPPARSEWLEITADLIREEKTSHKGHEK